METMQSHTQWYVYELIDPRSGKVFYVGKGKGNRMHHHERDAKGGICSKKNNKINSIWNAGYQIHKHKVAEFWDESAAYDHETDVIEAYGLENLTNIVKGGNGAWSNRLMTRRKARAAVERKPVILHEWIENQSSETVFQRFADWFLMGMHEGKHQLKVISCKNGFKFNAAVTEGLHNHIFPAIWKKIAIDQKAKESFAIRMKPYCVEFVNGRA